MSRGEKKRDRAFMIGDDMDPWIRLTWPTVKLLRSVAMPDADWDEIIWSLLTPDGIANAVHRVRSLPR